MVIWPKRFNIYLGCLAVLALLAGCQMGANGALNRHATLLSLHMEAEPDPNGRTETVTIPRANLTIVVEKLPILTQNDVKEARVMESLGSFTLRIEFTQHGAMLLEQYTAVNPGKHFAIYSRTWTNKQLKLGRWLSAPLITRRIGDGVLNFTPDATREEAQQIAEGLNAAAEKVKSDYLQ